jgi:putative ABC transport system permease protein
VFSAIVLESTAIAALGSLLGYLVYGAIVVAAALVVKQQTGVVIDPLKYHPALVLTVVGMILVGAAAGVVPAFKAYATDVASNLVSTS